MRRVWRTVTLTCACELVHMCACAVHTPPRVRNLSLGQKRKLVKECFVVSCQQLRPEAGLCPCAPASGAHLRPWDLLGNTLRPLWGRLFGEQGGLSQRSGAPRFPSPCLGGPEHGNLGQVVQSC